VGISPDAALLAIVDPLGAPRLLQVVKSSRPAGSLPDVSCAARFSIGGTVVIIKSLDELRQVDERTLIFTPMGLGIGVQMRPEDSAEYQQQVVAQFELAPTVAEGTRKSFDDLRTVFGYSVLCYELFTLVNDHALLVLEQALRDRFIEFHQGTVTFVDRADAEHAVAAERYEQVYEFASAHRGWRLRRGDGHSMPFDGMLSSLRGWTRRVGLLRGQRNRGIEQAKSNRRNSVAHPSGYHMHGPVAAARTLSDLAEIINQLWGVPTPGGRLYPAPVQREVIVMAWNAAGTELNTALATALADAVDPDDQPWQCVTLRAVFHPGEHYIDPELRYFDARFEATRHPADLLWGPGSITDAAAWFAEHQPEPDQCDYLDRTFVVRLDGDQLYLPMRPSVAAALPDVSAAAPGMRSRPTTPTTPSTTSATSSRASPAPGSGRVGSATPKPSASVPTRTSQRRSPVPQQT